MVLFVIYACHQFSKFTHSMRNWDLDLAGLHRIIILKQYCRTIFIFPCVWINKIAFQHSNIFDIMLLCAEMLYCYVKYQDKKCEGCNLNLLFSFIITQDFRKLSTKNQIVGVIFQHFCSNKLRSCFTLMLEILYAFLLKKLQQQLSII